jgi:hypothetical protein
MAKLTGGPGLRAIHHDGRLYRPDRKGVWTVPDAAVEALRPHGLAPLGEAPVPDRSTVLESALKEARDTVAELEARIAELERELEKRGAG